MAISLQKVCLCSKSGDLRESQQKNNLSTNKAKLITRNQVLVNQIKKYQSVYMDYHKRSIQIQINPEDMDFSTDVDTWKQIRDVSDVIYKLQMDLFIQKRKYKMRNSSDQNNMWI
jgi:hypothetical protein